MIYPCYGYIARAPGCHSRCEAYRQASKAQEEAAQARKQARSAGQFVWDVKDNGIYYWRKSGRR